MATRTYIIRGQVIAKGIALHEQVHESLQAQVSEAYFCPVCADIWARCPVDPAQHWTVLTRPCERHRTGWCTVAGSLWMPWKSDTYVKTLPKAVLYRELELTIQHFEIYGRV